MDKPELQDNPKVWWDEAAVTVVVKEYVAKWKVDVVSISRQQNCVESRLTPMPRSSLLTAAACLVTSTIEQ